MNENINIVNNIQQAIGYIESLKQQALSGGSITDESDNFNKLIEKLKKNEMSAADATLEADNIVSRRQDYH